MMLKAKQRAMIPRTPALPPTAPAKVAMLCFFACLEVGTDQMISIMLEERCDERKEVEQRIDRNIPIMKRN